MEDRFGELPRGSGIHFVGVAGSGMNPLARYLASRKRWIITGSDRSFDRNLNPVMRQMLLDQGIGIAPQDGRLPDNGTNLVIVSGAVEDTIPDVRAAKNLNIPVITRARLLADLTASTSSIAIAGTSGKTTVTAMCGWIMHHAGLQPNVICGGLMRGITADGTDDNMMIGESDYVVFEADESDGSIVGYHPMTGILLNISKDHKPLSELMELFSTYVKNCTTTIIANGDDRDVATCLTRTRTALNHGSQLIRFGMKNQADIMATDVVTAGWGCAFSVNGTPFTLRVPGRHNVMNALAAISLGVTLHIPLPRIAAALERFEGTRRRLDVIGVQNGITVIDDFAHNPDKIEASLQTLRNLTDRIIVYFQPHGFGPTAFLRKELVESFATSLRPQDSLVLSEIFYAGGSVNRIISSADLAADLAELGTDVRVIDSREQVRTFLTSSAKKGDIIVVMGARDDTLTDFARSILEFLSKET